MTVKIDTLQRVIDTIHTGGGGGGGGGGSWGHSSKLSGAIERGKSYDHSSICNLQKKDSTPRKNLG